MRAFGLVLAVFGLLAPPGAAQPDSLAHRFGEATDAYTQGRYEQAVETYRSILDAGYASAALYHNLGNAYVRLERVGPAIWAYERARRLRPDDPRLRHNLEFVRRRAGLPLEGLPPRGFAALVAGWSPWLVYGGGWLLIALGAWLGAYWAGPDRRFAWRSLTVGGLLAVGVLGVGVALGTSYLQAHQSRAIVAAEQVPLRAAPQETARPDTTVPGGAMVEVRREQAQWRHVRLGDGTSGWLPATTLWDV